MTEDPFLRAVEERQRRAGDEYLKRHEELRTQRDGLLRAELARQRAAFMAAPPIAAHANVDQMVKQTLADRVKKRAAAIARGEVCNPKIWKTDIKPIRGRTIDLPTWRLRAKYEIRRRAKGDVLASTLSNAAAFFANILGNIKDGYFQKKFEELARHFGCGRETARKVVRWFEQRGLLDTFNVLQRVGDEIQRDSNLYLLPEAPPTPSLPAAETLASRLQRYASWFGLQARAWGLNATPSAVGYKTAAEAPSTA